MIPGAHGYPYLGPDEIIEPTDDELNLESMEAHEA